MNKKKWRWNHFYLQVDVFSFGIVLWEILTGEEPYANMHYGAIIGAYSLTYDPWFDIETDYHTRLGLIRVIFLFGLSFALTDFQRNWGSNRWFSNISMLSGGLIFFLDMTVYLNNSLNLRSSAGGIVNNTLRPTIPSYCDSDWRILMEECWAPIPTARPSFTEIAGRLRVMSTAATSNQSKPPAHNKASK